MIIIQKNFMEPYNERGPMIREVYPEKPIGHPYASTPEGNEPYWVDKCNYLSSDNLAKNNEKAEEVVKEEISEVESTPTSKESTPTSKKSTPVSTKTEVIKEESSVPQVISNPEESSKEGLSSGAKAGLTAAGIAAAGAAGYAAYKAWKKRKAKKAAVDAEVNEFLKNINKTK